MQTKKGVGFALITVLMWALLAITLKVASHQLDSLSIVWLRFLIAFLLMALVYVFKDPRFFLSFFSPSKPILLATLGLALNYWGFMKGVELISPSNAQVFMQTGPILVVLVGILWLKESFNKGQIFGLMLSSLGFVLFFRDQLNAFWEKADLYYQGSLWLLFGAMTWTVFAVIQKKLVQTGVNPQRMNVLIYGYSALIFLPFADISAISMIPSSEWPMFFFLGLNTVIAYGALGEAFRFAPASLVSVIITTNPILTMFTMSFLTLSENSRIEPEHISRQGWIGAMCVIMGAACVVSFKAEGVPPSALPPSFAKGGSL